MLYHVVAHRGLFLFNAVANCAGVKTKRASRTCHQSPRTWSGSSRRRRRASVEARSWGLHMRTHYPPRVGSTSLSTPTSSSTYRPCSPTRPRAAAAVHRRRCGRGDADRPGGSAAARDARDSYDIRGSRRRRRRRSGARVRRRVGGIFRSRVGIASGADVAHARA